MRHDLIKVVDQEIARGIKKWGGADRSPEVLLNAATEELGKVARAYNHGEGIERLQQEIAECIGVLVRLYEMVEETAPVQVTLDGIVERVLEAFKIRHVDLKGRNRNARLVQVRQITMYLMRQETDRPLREISEAIMRCPSTISYAYGKIAAEMMADAELRRTVLSLQYGLRRQ